MTYMKTRIVHTKIWEDEFFSELTSKQKLLFIYYITNDNIGLTGIYEVTNKQTAFDTGITVNEIEACKIIFSGAEKILFYKNWVKVINAQKLNGYTGEKLNTAIDKELASIPDEIKEKLDTLSIPHDTPSIGYEEVSTTGDTPINHKEEIINHKSEIGGIPKGGIEELKTDEAYLLSLAEKNNVPMSFILSKLDDLDNWLGEKPSRARGRNLRRTLGVWVKKDALNLRKEENGRSKIRVITPDPDWENIG